MSCGGPANSRTRVRAFVLLPSPLEGEGLEVRGLSANVPKLVIVHEPPEDQFTHAHAQPSGVGPDLSASDYDAPAFAVDAAQTAALLAAAPAAAC